MKRLVLCFDGTWNTADSDGADTNVALISRAVHANTNTNGVPQSVLYLRGVGTTGLDAEKILAGATGLGIDDNIRSGYMFLAQNYVPGDEIYLFGFSRGAFTARSVVGLISAAGLLQRQSLGALGAAWKYYRTPKPHSPAQFMAATPGVQSHEDVSITFLGVWDTVGSLGIPGPILAPINSALYGFYDTGACRIVKKGCHAMAIDEHRDTFVPSLWTGEEPAGSSIEQVWFAGAHADVGGGYRTRALADIPLVWMARKAEAAGLVLDWSCLPDPAKLDPLAAQHDSSSGIFAISHILPMIRQICGKSFHVPPYQRLYRPIGPDHQPLATIGEAVHESAIRRFKAQGLVCKVDDRGECEPDQYHPKNLAALYDDAGRIDPKVGVAR